MKKFTLFLFAFFLSFIIFMEKIASGENVRENWPIQKQDVSYKKIILKALMKWKEDGLTLVDLDKIKHNPKGLYAYYRNNSYNPKETDNLRFDSSGIPMWKRGNLFFYHPVGLAQFALKYYGVYILSGDKKAANDFLKIANKLLQIQEKNGAIPYGFPFLYYLTNQTYEPGWVSAMAQGQVLSTFSRAFYLTEDTKWLNACEMTFRFLVTPKENGGVLTDLSDLDPSLKNYVYFEEYLSSPNNYTLNGYMFALLGIYDWLKLCEEINYPSAEILYYWQEGIKTLKKILPLYDVGGMSAYDLGHYTFLGKNPNISVIYHRVHIWLLKAINSIVEDEYFDIIAGKWAEYVM